MDVLNPSPALCLPQAMWLTYRTIMERSDLTEEEILALVTPTAMRESAPGGGAHATRALRGLREFGLVQQSNDGLYGAEVVKGAAGFLRLLRHRLVAPPATLGPEMKGAPDLRQGLVWLMRQIPAQPLYWADVQTSMPANLFTNDTRWNAFRWWSQALGFSQSALSIMATGADQKLTGAKIVADPTEAVIDVILHPLGSPLSRREQIPIDQLLAFLRDEIPVLPGHPSATYEGLADADAGAMRALGLALSCAETRGVLSMIHQSDPSGVMALPDAREHGRDRYVSAVTIEG
ncbi:hypothetical protein BOO86_23915 [Mycobacterium sp. CBMA 234]|uniref:hypothetical protein n=1 Tax=Mycolicibacterium sp. CBMA 234 TaxID=1918495 RepID=UPI0012DDA674|nr:hypothetical protein [Mycolicibacterium sp. CBMA 234]MUL67539.1 hypothetical protein [Mycolicibacterium sp. CBMA 234]